MNGNNFLLHCQHQEDIRNFFKNKKILITGASGFVGKNLVEFFNELKIENFEMVLLCGQKDLDLTDQCAVRCYFSDVVKKKKIDCIFHLAGLVGGIKSMILHPAEHYYTNLLTSTFVIHYGMKYVKKICVIGAGCSYPVELEFLSEEKMWDGLPQKESMTYSLAKRVLQAQALAYEAEYKKPVVIPLPGNIYGEHDNYNLQHSHVIPALIRKIYEAKKNNSDVEIWGTGNAIRDFIYIKDAVVGIVLSMIKYNTTQLVNISTGVGVSIKQVVNIIGSKLDFKGKYIFTGELEGQKKRIFNCSKADRELNWRPLYTIEDGIESTIKWFTENYEEGFVRL